MVTERLEDLHALVRRHLGPALRAWKLTSAQYGALRSLMSRGEASGRELARTLGVRHQTMQRMLEQLARRSLVDRLEAAGPGTARSVRITRKGVVLVERCRTAFLEIEHAMLARFTNELVETLEELLEECAAQLRRRTRPPVPRAPRRRPEP